MDQVYHESVERLPAAFKSTVEEWVKGEKYLYADKIAPEYLQSISPNIMKYKVRPSALRKFTDDNKRNHYLQRTVEEAERNGWNSWTSIEDDELLDLVRNTWATGAVFTFLNEETGSSSDSYFIAIVPPHRISKKKQIDEQIPLMNQFGIPPEFIKQIVSGKFE